MSAPDTSGSDAGDPAPDEESAASIISAEASAQMVAGLAVLWEVDIGDTGLAVTFDPAEPC